MKLRRVLHAAIPSLAVWAFLIPLCGPHAARVLPAIGCGPLTWLGGARVLDSSPASWIAGLISFATIVTIMSRMRNPGLACIVAIAWPVAGAWAFLQIFCRSFIT